MSDNTIFVKKYENDNPLLAVNEQEIWRYSGYMGMKEAVDENIRSLLSELQNEVKNSFSYKVCFRRMELTWEKDSPRLPLGIRSADLAKCLWGSSEVILFAATVGLEIDRYIARYQRFSPTKALLLQAYGAERVESLCNAFCGEMEKEAAEKGLNCTARFSPGYGDLPLGAQREFFRLLDCNRQIGISLNESLLMTPSKSVTAIFGIGDCVGSVRVHKCENCEKTDCQFRRRGM